MTALGWQLESAEFRLRPFDAIPLTGAGRTFRHILLASCRGASLDIRTSHHLYLTMSQGRAIVPLEDIQYRLPTTRYRGSKRRYAFQIARELAISEAERVVDPFGGSGVVSGIGDALGMKSVYNDLYHWVVVCARTLFEHNYTRRDLETVLHRVERATAQATAGFISEYYDECYFTRAENLELDGLLDELEQTRADRLKDLMFYGVAQAALAKMPMSMFHRASIRQRIAKVPRRSRNSLIWNTPFRVLVPRYVQEAVLYTWLRRRRHEVTQGSALDVTDAIRSGDVLFLDPPYINPKGGVPAYGEAYHFLEGFSRGQDVWERWLDGSRSHPIFRGFPQSSFDSPDGWRSGVGTLLDTVDGGSVLATGRLRDRPGARTLKSLLRARFRNVATQNLHSSTIFSPIPNREYLFVAS